MTRANRWARRVCNNGRIQSVSSEGSSAPTASFTVISIVGGCSGAGPITTRVGPFRVGYSSPSSSTRNACVSPLVGGRDKQSTYYSNPPRWRFDVQYFFLLALNRRKKRGRPWPESCLLLNRHQQIASLLVNTNEVRNRVGCIRRGFERVQTLAEISPTADSWVVALDSVAGS